MIPVTRTDISPGAFGSWQDVDVSAYVDAGNTAGVMLEIIGTGENPYAVRKNGSSDERYIDMYFSYHTFIAVGIDEDDIFEAKIADSSIHIYIVGYIKNDEGAFFTNGIDKSLGSTAEWIDIDISGDTGDDTAKCAFFEVYVGSTGGSGYHGFRQNGSEDTWTAREWKNSHIGGMMAVDGGEILEGYITHLLIDFYLLGYLTDCVTSWVNGKDYSTETTVEWVDADMSSDIPSGNDGAFVALQTTALSFGIRKDGEEYDNYLNISSWGWVELDSGRVCEQRIQNDTCDLFLWGYTSSAPPSNQAPTAPSSLLCEDEASPVSNVTDLTPEFSAIFEDPDSDDLADAIEIHVATTLEGLDSPDMWNSGWIDISGESLVEGNRCNDQSYTGSALSLDGTTYYWKCRFRDDDEDEGAWSAVANFTMFETLGPEYPSIPPTITFVDANNKTVDENNPMIFGAAIRRNSITEYSGNPLRIWNAKVSPSGVYTARNIELTMITTVAEDPDGDSEATPISSGREWIRDQWTSIKSNGMGGFTGSGNPPWGGNINHDGMTDDVEAVWSNIGGAQDSDYHSIGDIQPSSYREIYWRVYPPAGITLIDQFIYTQARIVYEFL